jgi:chromosome segregation ATPase
MKGAETLGLLLHDTQAENLALKQKVDRLETALGKLDDQHSFMKKTGSGQGPQSVGASRRVVEDLVKSNAKLQQEIQRLKAGDTSPRKEDWVLVTGELRRENHELRTELNTAKTALESLSSGDFSGDDSSLHSSAAAAELVRLSKRVAHAEKLIKTKDVLIEGLSEQVGKLRKENEHLAEQVAHLEVNARAKGEMSNAGISSHADLELVKRLQHELKEKNGIIKDLEENIGTITMEKDKAMDVNSQWVTHNKVQEADLVTLREQKSRLEGELEEHQQAHDTRIREVDKVLMSAKTIVDRERQEKLTAQTELKRAKDKCDLLEGKFNMVDEQFKLECTKRQQLEQEVKDMKKQSGNSDNIAVLEQQVNSQCITTPGYS